MNRRDLQELSKLRLKEAQALFELGMYDGAYYLAGYAVECALKACIAKKTMRSEFPDKKRAELSFTHSLKDLVRVAGLEDARSQKVGLDRAFRDKWQVAAAWTEQSRYRKNDRRAAQELLEAVSNRDGVVSWIRRYW